MTTAVPPIEVSYADGDAEAGRLVAGPVASVGIPVFQGDDGPLLADGVPDPVVIGSDTVAVGVDGALCARRGFTGKEGTTLVSLGMAGAPAVVYVGCGDPEKGSPDTARRAAATFARAAGRSGVAVMVLPASLVETGAEAQRRAAQALAEGAVLATYRFTEHKSEDDAGQIDRLVVLGAGLDVEAGRAGVGRGVRIARAVRLARDLVNEPPSTMTPRRLAEIAEQELGSQAGVTLEVWDEQRITDERLGGLLGVARGSAEPPRFLRATYDPFRPGGGGRSGAPHRAGGQGHHLRFRRALVEDARRHGDDEDGHERGGRRDRRALRLQRPWCPGAT